MAIKTIIFDLDDTLLPEEESVKAAFGAACKLVYGKYGIAAEKFYSTVRSEARQLWHSSPQRDYCLGIGLSSWEGLWTQFEGIEPVFKSMLGWLKWYQLQAWINALKKFDINDETFAAQLSKECQDSRRSGLANHFLYPDAKETLEKLRKEYELAMLTNGVPDLQYDKLKKTGLGEYFETVVISGQFGIGKPDRRIFDIILERLGITADKAVMVGDRIESDITGAKNSGVKSVWLNRDGKTNGKSVKPDFEITGLDQLHSVLTKLHSC